MRAAFCLGYAALSVRRDDGQRYDRNSFHLSPGQEPGEGDCPPLVVPQPGQEPAPIYLTQEYKGAPYGLSIVVPLHVGPFTLTTQIVRAKIEVDPVTTQLTITTDPLPTIIDGIPADLRAINAVIDRPGFMFNPTGCEPGAFSGTATSTEGATAPISSHFQMGSCRSLTFKPDFRVSTSGKTSRKEAIALGDESAAHAAMIQHIGVGGKVFADMIAQMGRNP